jgi:tetratricopeptide (TPR) repeat protein
VKDTSLFRIGGFTLNILKKLFHGIAKDQSQKASDNKVDIRKNILDCVGPHCIRLSNPEEIISLGQDAVPVAIDILKNTGSANQAILTIALRQFASQGNEQAGQALYDIAAGKITVYSTSFGDVALKEAQEYVAETKGSSPKTLLKEAFQFEQAKQFDKAIEKFKEYYSVVPDDLSVRIAIGVMYKELGEFTEAIKWWEEALANGLQWPDSDFVRKDIEKAKAALGQDSK